MFIYINDILISRKSPDEQGALQRQLFARLQEHSFDIFIGTTVEHFIGDVQKPLAFSNRQLHQLERKYNASDRVLLTLYLADCHFCSFLDAD